MWIRPLAASHLDARTDVLLLDHIHVPVVVFQQFARVHLHVARLRLGAWLSSGVPRLRVLAFLLEGERGVGKVVLVRRPQTRRPFLGRALRWGATGFPSLGEVPPRRSLLLGRRHDPAPSTRTYQMQDSPNAQETITR